MSDKTQNYELAFHINPDLEEAKAIETKQSIEGEITSLQGVITFTKELDKIRLSYPVKHFRTSYFGYVQFNLSAPEALENLNSQLKLNPQIVRYLIIKMPSDLKKKQSLMKQLRTRERIERKPAVKLPEKEGKEIDKQLEEIIGNL